MSTASLFVRSDNRFVPTEVARGPWSLDFLHGGPVAALLAWAIEQRETDPAFQPARLTVDLFRPVPYSPLEVTSRVVRAGKRVCVIDAGLTANGVEVSRASALLLRHVDVDSPAALDAPSVTPPPPDALPPYEQPFSSEGVAYHTAVEYRRADPESPRGAVVWVRLPFALLPEADMSPLVHAAAIADFVNPFANLPAGTRIGFINADVNVFLHRPPLGDWLCLAVSSRRSARGVAVADAALLDTSGPAGRCLVTSIANPGAMFAGQAADGSVAAR